MSRKEGLEWVAWMGDFALLRSLLSRKRHSSLWMLFGWIDAFLRGYGQVVFANNPISGIFIISALAVTVPGSLVAGAGTGFLGLLLSLLLRDTWETIGNGLTVYNPLLIGAVTYSLAPNFYGNLDAFAILIILVGTIFSVYLTRSLATGRFPCITVPFNVVELILLLILTRHRDFAEFAEIPETTTASIEKLGSGDDAQNSTGIFNKSSLINQSFTTDELEWGMIDFASGDMKRASHWSKDSFIFKVFRGVVVSASQVYAVDNVAAGSVIYLGIVIYSPTTGLFSLLGALTGCLIALGLDVPYAAIYAGLWGYNSLLTGAAFGGLFIVITGQTSAAAFVAIVFTTLLQYVVEPLMTKAGLPVLTVPFVVTAWLFFGLRDTTDATFPRPTFVTFPEHEVNDFRSQRRDLKVYTVDECIDPELPNPDEKKSSND